MTNFIHTLFALLNTQRASTTHGMMQTERVQIPLNPPLTKGEMMAVVDTVGVQPNRPPLRKRGARGDLKAFGWRGLLWLCVLASLFGMTVQAATVPDAPTITSANAFSTTVAYVHYTAPANDGGSAITRYIVSSNPAAAIDEDPDWTSLTHAVSGLTSGSSYTFSVVACNSVGCSAPSAPSNSYLSITQPSSPGISAIVVGDGQVTVTLTPPTDEGGDPIYGYVVASDPSDGTDTTPFSLNPSHVITGLQNGATYTFHAGACNRAGCGFSTISNPITLPAVPPGSMGVDLTLSQLSSSQTAVLIGQTLDISTTENNLGQQAADNHSIQYYLSQNYYDLHPNSILLGERTVSGLGANSSDTTITQLTIPNTVPSGYYTIAAVVDSNHSVAELNENNNLTVGNLVIVTHDVDLHFSQFSTSSSQLSAGGKFTINSTVHNQGRDALENSVQIKFILGTTNDLYAANGIELVSRTLNTLAGGASENVSQEVTLPSNLPPGTYFLNAYLDYYNNQSETNKDNNYGFLANPLTLAPAIVTSADLVISNLASNTNQLGIGTSLQLNTSETNRGNLATSANNTIKFYLSSDNVIDSSDILLGSRTVGILNAGATNTSTTTLSIPKTVPPGVYYLGAIADANNAITESDKTNNSLAGNTLTIVRNVDLLISALSTNTIQVGIGATFNIDSSETNQGLTVTSSSNVIKFYLSTDNQIDSTDILLTGSRTVSTLNAGATSQATTIVTVPKNVIPGMYYLGAIADANNRQVESDETNNSRAGNTITITREVDLVISAISTPATNVGIGATFNIDSSETNQGTTVTSASNTIKFYLSTDNVIDSTDILLTGTRAVSTLNPSAISQAVTTITVPKTLAPGTYYLGAIADATETQTETNETNNSLAGNTITVFRDVDLVLTALSSSSPSIPIGTSFTLDNTIANQGTTVTSNPSVIRFYLSTDNQITSTDTLIANRNVSSLNTGASAQAVTSASISKVLAPGVYYLGALVDASNTQVENNEDNNMFVGNTVTVTRDVDLVMSQLSTTATNVGIGATFDIDSSETNQGTTVTSNSNTIRFYLSTDNQISATDTLLTGTRAVSTLNTGATSQAVTTVTVPKTLAPGTYYIGAIADATDTQPETNETNNALAGNTITVFRDIDLIISSLSVNTTSQPAGGSVFVDHTVTNQGTTSSTAANAVRFYLSTDNTITTSDTLMGGSRGVPIIAAGASNTGSTTATVPKTTKLGTYYIGACADATNVQVESNENNNCALANTQLTVTQNVAPTIGLSSDQTSAGAPATFKLTSTPADSDGYVNKVEFYANNTLLSSVIISPFNYTWANVAPGSYSLTAKATDNVGATAISAPVNVTVSETGPQMYFIHTDHLNTPRVITDEANNTVWQWDNVDPFGANVPNENPGGLGKFEFPLRFAGQVADKETGLYYNYFRTYDPATGRYIESDPIGLGGGINTYGYAAGNPSMWVDILGLDFVRPYGQPSVMDPSPFSVKSSQVCLQGACHGVSYTTDRRYTNPTEDALVSAIYDVSTIAGGAITSGARRLANACSANETFYRTMSSADHSMLMNTGNLPATSETFISPARSFAQGYNGTLVEFTMNPGTTSALENIGVRDSSLLTKTAYPDMPIVSKGWKENNAYFKGEGSQINIGLGKGKALDVFNSNIRSIK